MPWPYPRGKSASMAPDSAANTATRLLCSRSYTQLRRGRCQKHAIDRCEMAQVLVITIVVKGEKKGMLLTRESHTLIAEVDADMWRKAIANLVDEYIVGAI